jgi:hypothetical protein
MSDGNAWGCSLFADDIRQEIGGKQSLIGIYGGEMLFDNPFPILIPKFVVFVKFFEKKGVFQEDLILRITGPDSSVVFESTIPRSALDNAPTMPTLQAETDEPLINQVSVPITFSPFALSEPGYVSVRMHCGDHVTRLGRLMVRQQDSPVSAD